MDICPLLDVCQTILSRLVSLMGALQDGHKYINAGHMTKPGMICSRRMLFVASGCLQRNFTVVRDCKALAL